MHENDPLLGPTPNLPPADETPPKHSRAGSGLIATQTSVTDMKQDIRRIDRDILRLTTGLAVTFLLAVLIGFFLIGHGRDLNQLETRVTAADTERARVDAVHRSGECTALNAIRAAYNTIGRTTFPGGPLRYDILVSALTDTAATLNCRMR